MDLGFGPGERLGAFIIVPDEGVDMGTQLNDSVEGDPGRRLVCQDGEPNQDAVHASLNHDSAFRIGNLSGNVHRSRNALNADTIREMHATFRRGGRKAIETAMRNQPAVRFLEQSISMEKSPARPPEDRPRD